MVNRIELVDQSIGAIQAVNPDLFVDVLSSKNLYNPNVDVFVATYQSLSTPETLDSLDMSKFKLIVIDEAHHAVAPTIVNILVKFGVVGDLKQSDEKPEMANDVLTEDSDPKFQEIARREPPIDRRVHVMGFSATFWRDDRGFLSDVFDEVAFHENVESMMKEKFLCPARITDIKLPFESQRTVGGKKKGIDVNAFFRSDQGIELVYNVWRSKAYKSTVIFGCNMDHILRMTEYFRTQGVDARVIHSKLHKSDRTDVLADFKAGKFPVIMNCQVLTEGTDVPRIDQVIIARGMYRTGMIMQMIGRGLRLYDEKEHCNIVVFSNFRNFTKHLHFLPELDNDTLVVQREAREFCKLELAGTIDPPVELEDCVPTVDYRKIVASDEEFSLERMTNENYHPDSPDLSVLRWVERGKKFYLFLLESQFSYISISKPFGVEDYEVAYTKRRAKNYLERRVLHNSNDLREATKAADVFVAKKFPRAVYHLRHDAKWTGLEPTPKQLDFLKPKTAGIDLSMLSRGAACTLMNLSFLRFKLSRELVADVISSQPKRDDGFGLDLDAIRLDVLNNGTDPLDREPTNVSAYQPSPFYGGRPDAFKGNYAEISLDNEETEFVE